METQTQTPTITVQPTTLFDVYLHALESGEFVQLRREVWDAGNGRCVIGVAATILSRAGYPGWYFAALHPQFVPINFRAGQLLGYDCIASANDGGESFKVIAPALRRARLDVEGGAS